jgi:hypothetical protein
VQEGHVLSDVANQLRPAVQEAVNSGQLPPWLVLDLKKSLDEFNPAGRELSFSFKDFGQLGLELTGNAVTDVHGQAKSLGIQPGDKFVAIDNHPASETTELLIQQLQALPRPGSVVFRRENPGAQVFTLQQR